MSVYENYVTLLNVNDGAPGDPGAPGKDAQKYKIETNQDEILKFFSDEDQKKGWNFSPNAFTISIHEIVPEEDTGFKKINIDEKLLELFAYNNNDWQKFEVPANFSVAIGENEEPISYIYSQYDSGSLTIYFDALEDYASDDKLIGESDNDYNNRISLEAHQICKTLLENDTILKIEYKITDGDKNYFVQKLITIRHAMTQDMAKLALKADGIYASIASTALEFTADGLSVRNGGLKIFNKDEKEVFGADTEGNLEISGVIHASGGDFTGTITANSGTIGGFEIGKHEIASGGLSLQSSYTAENGESVPSKIVADNIEIGTGAIIKEYIALGKNVKIWNPTNTSAQGAFISVGNEKNLISLNDDGTIVLGNEKESFIKLDGANQEIYAMNQGDTNYSWIINPNEAIFNNITARGSIKATTFEYGTVQAIGGTLLVRPSSRIVDIQEVNKNLYRAVLENAQGGFIKGDICIIEPNSNGENPQGTKFSYFVIEEEVVDNTIYISPKSELDISLNSSYIGAPIINLGQKEKKSVGIAINGSGQYVYGINPNTLSVVEHDGNGVLNSKIILGKLPNEEIYGQAAGSYGLYAENVVLNGALTTKSDAPEENFSYSGLGTAFYNNAPNTLSMKDRFPKASLGQILLWAGAEGTSKDAIEKSNFFVDQYGNMYANSGYFEGTIITNSTIEAAEIQTAILTGTGADTGPALIIKDVAQGIHFCKSAEGEDGTDVQVPIFKVGKDVFETTGLPISFNRESSKGLTIGENGDVSAPSINLGSLVIEQTYIKEKEGGAKIDFKDSALDLQAAQVSRIVLNSSGTNINGSIFYVDDENSVKGEYRQIKNDEQVVGYDLYIY